MAPRWTGKRIVALQLLQQVGGLFNGLISWEHIPFMLLYAWVLQWCFSTMGEPLAKALAKAEADGIALPNTVEHLKEQASVFLLKTGLEPKEEKPSLWTLLGGEAPAPTPVPGFTLPSRYLPSFWPLFFLGTIATLHALIILLQVWIVDFRGWMRFRKVTSVSKATHVKIVPKAHRGKKQIIGIDKTALGSSFTYQRRKYIYDPSDDIFHKVRCKSDYPLSFFFRWRGFSSNAEVKDAQERYGKNKFEISLPAFMDLYKQQLVSPFTVFQLFCVILWCLDSYWQYSVFTLFMIFSFEASVVFQRIKNLNTLKGMDNREIDVLVYRGGSWEATKTTELVPGDLFSLTRSKDNDIVPCDCLLLRGTAVLNEATLTGESIPQMKDAVHHSSNEVLDLKGGASKVHVLFGGTRVLQVTGVAAGGEGITDVLDEQERAEEGVDTKSDDGNPEEALGELEVSSPPDKGCVCYALRTGFSSSQGKLVRMIEGSTESVRSDTRDTAMMLLLLLIFAVAASGYVLKKGIEAGNKSKYQLLLHCVLIITSVIPPELPMQMALAVNNALITLMRMQIFCTEPFRVPVAGKIDVCLFDKTGTLTTDELVAVGVTNLRTSQGGAPGGSSTGGSEAASLGLAGMPEAPSEATVVLGACHALVLIDGKVAGDPIEAAALKAIKWEILERPGQPTDCRPLPQQLNERGGSFTIGGLRLTSLSIMARHHFSSKLQRMSAVAKANGQPDKAIVLVKGSPEIIATLLAPGSLPARYHESAAHLAKEGMRVLALAYKVVSGDEAIKASCEDRAEAEGFLEFAGFVAFTCRVRKDTAAVIAQLVEGRHAIAMVTGDALLTAIHVAKQVGICRATKKGILILEADKQEQVIWKDYHTGNKAAEPFDASSIPALAKSYELCTAGKPLALASAKHPEIRRHLEHFSVFARMTPEEKEAVITSMKDCGHFTLMCGDGANDVGALKQANVGVALLSGFGDLNVDRGGDKKEEEEAGTAIMTKEELEGLQRLRPLEIKKKLRALGVAPEDHPECVEKSDLIRLYQQVMAKRAVVAHDKKNAQAAAPGLVMMPGVKGKKTPEDMRAEMERQKREMVAKKQAELKADLEERTARGESFAMAKALYAMYQREAAEGKKRREQMIKDSTITASAAKMAAMMDEMEEGDLPMVKIGDASVAAPFTSKMPSIRGVVDIIRQGRCTLVTTIQMYQILALTCLISSYSLSVLHLDGVKYGDYQMTALGILMSISFVTVSRSKPLEKLSGVRPFGSVFHPALFLSILGQFALHLVSMMLAVGESKKYLPADYKPDPDGDFKPGIVNSVVFLVSAVQQVSVFVVNLKGPPFMSGLGDNSPLLYSLASTFVLTFLLASETIPQLNKFLQLVPFPDPGFRTFVLLTLGADIGLSFFWDRLMTSLFAPQVLRASMEGVTMKDVWRMMRVLGVITFLIWFLSQGDLEALEEELFSEGKVNATANVTSVEEIAKATGAVVLPTPPVEEVVIDEFNA